jgi:nucleotide-binding universal stress UspA family protein
MPRTLVAVAVIDGWRRTAELVNRFVAGGSVFEGLAREAPRPVLVVR